MTQPTILPPPHKSTISAQGGALEVMLRVHLTSPLKSADAIRQAIANIESGGSASETAFISTDGASLAFIPTIMPHDPHS